MSIVPKIIIRKLKAIYLKDNSLKYFWNIFFTSTTKTGIESKLNIKVTILDDKSFLVIKWYGTIIKIAGSTPK